jgi:hypothetical protein
MKKIVEVKKCLWVIAFVLALNLVFAEDRSNNPLYKALPSLDKTMKALIEFPTQEEGFVSIPFRESLEANWIQTEANFFEDPGVVLAEKNFECMCQESPRITNQIPRIIHLIWLGSAPPLYVELAIQSWRRYHPDWEIKLWTEESLKNFQWSSPRSEKVFQVGRNWSEKSDILRFEILYQFGGIYSDTDVVCLKSFEPLISKPISFFAGFESNKIKRFGRPLIGSAIVGAAKNCPVVQRCIDFTQSIEEAPTIHQHLRSGPGPVTKASYERLENGGKDIVLLPCSYLYPLPWEKRLASPEEIEHNIRKESFAIHLWDGSWFDFYKPPKS